MVSKDLVKRMSIAELNRYCEEHPEYRVPNANEAEMIETDHSTFWTCEELGDRCVTYQKEKQMFRRSHPVFLHSCVVVKDD